MKSDLNKSEFKMRLSELTSDGKDFYLITPYDFSGKPFCGKFDDTTFELTRNSFWRRVNAIVIKGEYRELDSVSTEVTYELGWTKLSRNLTIVIAGLCILAMNIIIIVNREGLEIPVLNVLLTLNAFMVFGCLVGFLINFFTKKIVNQRFKEEFEIEVKDEWSSHTDSLIYKRLTKS